MRYAEPCRRPLVLELRAAIEPEPDAGTDDEPTAFADGAVRATVRPSGDPATTTVDVVLRTSGADDAGPDADSSFPNDTRAFDARAFDTGHAAASGTHAGPDDARDTS